MIINPVDKLSRIYKGPFSWWISMDGSSNRRNKGAFFVHDGLVWTVALTVETKFRYRDRLVWTVAPAVDTKLHFRDGLVWTVALTVA